VPTDVLDMADLVRGRRRRCRRERGLADGVDVGGDVATSAAGTTTRASNRCCLPPL
jgi:hypothetical protein